MIIVIDALNRHLHEGILDDMFRLRARVFADRLGWEVTIEEGREIDAFDALDPAYVVGLDEEGDDAVIPHMDLGKMHRIRRPMRANPSSRPGCGSAHISTNCVVDAWSLLFASSPLAVRTRLATLSLFPVPPD